MISLLVLFAVFNIRRLNNVHLLLLLYGRLPIGGTGHKEARIPQPWRLQALLPKGCKGGSFLRMDLHRHSTIGDIRYAVQGEYVFVGIPVFN